MRNLAAGFVLGLALLVLVSAVMLPPHRFALMLAAGGMALVAMLVEARDDR